MSAPGFAFAAAMRSPTDLIGDAELTTSTIESSPSIATGSSSLTGSYESFSYRFGPIVSTSFGATSNV